jgi:glycerol-3-phosphate cytidylyltransferase
MIRGVRMKTILTYGTFDLLHKGHIRLLKRAKAMGDFLIVGLSTDEFNKLKGKDSYYTFEERKEMLEAIKYVDLVIPEINWEQKVEDITKYNADTFVMGDDWSGKFDSLKQYCNVNYLKRTDNISTTIIKNDLKNML